MPTIGMGLDFDPDRMDRRLRGIIEADRRISIDFGIDTSMGSLPHRFARKPLEEGPSKDQVATVR